MIPKILLFTFVVVRGMEAKRSERLLSFLNVVRFPNDPCTSQAPGVEGICYSAEECDYKVGQASGACASGFGVCCVFRLSCEDRSSENCTIFSSAAAGSSISDQGNTVNRLCVATICKASPNICKLRLDFIDFVLAGPSTDTTSIGTILNGASININNAAIGASVTSSSRCNSQYFQVSNPGGPTPPVVCGLNTGEHMYVDASDACNDLTMFLGIGGLQSSVANANSQWSIKVSQLKCDFDNLPPAGCTQWFYGSSSGLVRTFNYAGARHLASQEQLFCVRTEINTCEICWTTQTSSDFQVSGPGNMAITDSRLCCAYGITGNDDRGFDCLIVPGAKSISGAAIPAARFCGGSKGLVSKGSMTADTIKAFTGARINRTICSKVTPFNIRFVSDNFEFVPESVRGPKGFELVYSLRNC